MILVYLIVLLVYAVLVAFLRKGWASSVAASAERKGEAFAVSVVIPCRNEAENLPDLLSDLCRQTSSAPVQVIVIDDQSTDDTAEVALAFKDRLDLELLKLELPADFKGSHKKAAIELAVSNAIGDIIMCTDGDCRLTPNWILEMSRPFANPATKLVSGPVVFSEKKSLFNELLKVEFSSLIASGAASIWYQKPNMCNGANIAYRKSAFKAVNGFEGKEEIASGDDEFLMHKIFLADTDSLAFHANQGARVTTDAPENLKVLKSQRRRWASKWNHYDLHFAKYLAFVIFTVNLCSLLTWVQLFSSFFTATNTLSLFLLLILRALIDWAFLKPVVYRLYGKWSWRAFFALQLLYPVYVVFFGVSSNFGSFQWKGRTIND